MSDSENLGNAKAEWARWKQMANTSQFPADNFQERQPEYTQNEDSWKQEKKSEESHSTCSWKQKQSAGTHKKKSETKFRNVQSPIQQYVGKVFLNLQNKYGITSVSSTFEVEPMKTDLMMWGGSFMSSSMKAVIHLRQNYTENMAAFKNTDIEESQDLLRITHRLV